MYICLIISLPCLFCFSPSLYRPYYTNFCSCSGIIYFCRTNYQRKPTQPVFNSFFLLYSSVLTRMLDLANSDFYTLRFAPWHVFSFSTFTYAQGLFVSCWGFRLLTYSLESWLVGDLLEIKYHMKNHCEPLVAVWLWPSTTKLCICCKQVTEKPRGEHLKMYVYMTAPIFECWWQPSCTNEQRGSGCHDL